MEELYSTQEEADTRLLLHAIHASQNHSRVIIRCDYTDVMILLIDYCSLGQLSEVFMHAGHSGKMSQMRDMYQFTPLQKAYRGYV